MACTDNFNGDEDDQLSKWLTKTPFTSSFWGTTKMAIISGKHGGSPNWTINFASVMMRREAPSFHDLYHALWESVLGNPKTDKIAIALRMSCTILGSITSSCLEKWGWNIFFKLRHLQG